MTAITEFTGMPKGHFGALMVDPPWRFKRRSMKNASRLPPYPTMTFAEIKAAPIQELAARDCFLFLWTSGPHLSESLDIMTAWGFRYSSFAFVWIKTNPLAGHLFYDQSSFHVGMGYTTRKNAEYCLLGRRGHPKRISKNVHELIISTRREHSRKPDMAFQRAQQFCAGPYAEIFGRESRKNWTVWGNESTKFDPKETPA